MMLFYIKIVINRKIFVIIICCIARNVLVLQSEYRTLKPGIMKLSKKTVLLMTSMSQNGGRNKAAVASASAIRLKAVSDAERERLRIPSYQYILP